MTVRVEFPDGSIRDVPSVTVTTTRRPIGRRPGPSSHHQEPDYDPDWTFESTLEGKWFANPRR